MKKTPHVHVFGGQGWMQLIQGEHIEIGTRMVFTNLLNNRLSLMPFDASGLHMCDEVVERMPLDWRKPYVISVLDTKGMLHFN